MGTLDLVPRNLNFLEIAERVFRERQFLAWLDGVLLHPQAGRLSRGRVQQFQGLIADHLQALAAAEAEWRLDDRHLEECLAHLGKIGFAPRRGEALGLIQRVERFLMAVERINAALKIVESLEEPDEYLLDADEGQEGTAYEGS